MNPEKAQGLSPELQTALETLLAGIESLSEQIREYNERIETRTSFIAFGVVPSFCSSTIAPASSSTPYQFERSSRSNPIVSFA
jgi:hypothetical protein